MGTRTTGAPASRKRRELSPEGRARVVDFLEDELNGGGDLDGMASGDSGESTGGGDTHIHIHAGAAGGDAAAGVDPAADPAAGGEGGEGAIEKRISALESGQAQLIGLVQQLVDAGGAAKPEANDAAPGQEEGGEDMGQEAGSTGADLSEEGGGEGGAPDFTKDAPAKTNDAMTQDSAALETGFTQLLADAEILVPGSRFPTFGKAAQRKKTVDLMCSTRKRVLDHLYASPEGKVLIDSVAGSVVDLGKLDCATTAVIFKASAGAKRALNNAANTRDAGSVVKDQQQTTKIGGPVGKITSLADLNKMLDAHHAKQNVTAK